MRLINQNLYKTALLAIALVSGAVATYTEVAGEKMSGPAENGVLIYSNNVNRLAGFYEELFELSVLKKTEQFISLRKPGVDLIIHTPPQKIPPGDFGPVKMFFSVTDLELARESALQLGGAVFPGEWSNPFFTVANIADSDGNHIQIREFKENRSMNER